MKKLVSIIVVLFVFLTACSTGGSETKKDLSPEIWEAVQPEVAKQLKFPESAEFGSFEDATIYEEDGKYHVLGEVKGNNAFGVTVSNGFETIVTKTENGYSVGTIDMIDLTSYQTKTRLYKERINRIEKGEAFLSQEEVDEKIAEQPLAVTKAFITPKDQFQVYVSGDMLSAVLLNNSEEVILNAEVAFACWDSNGLPLKLYRAYGLNSSYILLGEYPNINLKTGKTFGETYGFEISEDINAEKVKAIVVSYEGLNGEKWENPYYLDFVEAYEGKELKEETE